MKKLCVSALLLAWALVAAAQPVPGHADCVSFDDTDEEQQEEQADVTIRVVGNNIVVEGVRDERVDIFDAHGRLVATARCNDHCVLTLGMQDHSYSPTTTSGTNAYWVQVGNRPRQRVFINEISNRERYQSYPFFSPPRPLQIN